MKFSAPILIVALASLASAQSIAELTAQIPSCAQTCLITAITGAGCTVGDLACQCGTSKNAITASATPCIISGCTSEEALNTQRTASQICALAAAGGSSSPSASASASASSSASAAASASLSAVSSALLSSASSVRSSASSAVSAATSRITSTRVVAGSATSAVSSATSAATAAGVKEEASFFFPAAAALAAVFAL